MTAAAAAFAALITDFSAWAGDAGYPVVPFYGERPVHFLALPPEHQQRVLGTFGTYVNVCREVRTAGHSLANDQVLFWAMIRRLNLRPLSAFMAEIEAGDVLEIHDRDLVQIFRSLGFFSLCRHALDDLLCRPFFELFRRDDQATAVVMDAARAALDRRILTTQRLTTDIHAIEEIGRPNGLRSLVENQVLSPLFDRDGNVGAIASTIRCHCQDHISAGP